MTYRSFLSDHTITHEGSRLVLRDADGVVMLQAYECTNAGRNVSSYLWAYARGEWDIEMLESIGVTVY